MFRIERNDISKHETQWHLSTDIEDHFKCHHCGKKHKSGFVYYCEVLDRTFCELCEFEKGNLFECYKGMMPKSIITSRGKSYQRNIKSEGHNHIRVKLKEV